MYKQHLQSLVASGGSDAGRFCFTIVLTRREENCSARGGGDTEPPPPPSLAAVTGRGVQGGGARPVVLRGEGVNPTSMAQNDTHVALIILTTQMWGGGLLVEKTFSGQNFVFLHLRRQHPFSHKTKGPARNPISPTPPPPSTASMSSPPPPRRAIFRSPKHYGTTLAILVQVCMTV